MVRTHYNFSENIHHVLIDGEFIIFDEKKGKYYLLDQENSCYLLQLFSNSDGSDNRPLLEFMLQLRILSSSNQQQTLKYYKSEDIGIDNYEWRLNKEHHSNKICAAHYLLALYSIMKIKFMLYFFGLGSTLKALKAKKYSSYRSRVIDSCYDAPYAINDALRKIALFLPFKVACLEHALALLQLLIHKKNRISFCIGVQKYTFLAHAWIEIDSQVIGDNPIIQEKLALIYKL